MKFSNTGKGDHTDSTVRAAFDLSKEVVKGVRDAGYWLQDVK